MKTRDQLLAEIAWQKVQQHQQHQDKNMLSHVCKEASARILTSGLLPTLAFSLAKGAAEGNEPNVVAHRHLGEALTALIAERFPHQGRQIGNIEQSLQSLIERDADLLRRATEEASALLGWMGRFADGLDGNDRNQLLQEGEAQ